MEKIEARIEKIRSGVLTANKTAELLKTTRNTLYRWEKNGTLIPYRTGGRVMYRAEDVINLLTGNK